MSKISLTIASAIALSLLAGVAHAASVGVTPTVAASSRSASDAAAIARGGNVTYAPTSTSNEVRQAPSFAMGSFGQGGNPCAEGIGVSLSGPGAGIGFNMATSGKQCNDRLTAASFMQFGVEYKDPRAAVTGLLVLCASDPNILQQCQASGIYVAPAVAPAIPSGLHAAYFGQQAPAQIPVTHVPYTSYGKPAAQPMAQADPCGGLHGSKELNCMSKHGLLTSFR